MTPGAREPQRRSAWASKSRARNRVHCGRHLAEAGFGDAAIAPSSIWARTEAIW